MPATQAAARVPAPVRKQGSLGHVIADYKASRFYTDKKKKTRTGYDYYIRVLEDWSRAAGEPHVSAIGPKAVEKLYEALRKKTPAKAHHTVTILRMLLAHAIRMELITFNAAANPKLKSIGGNGRLWPQDAIDLFVEVADRKGWHSVGTAVLMNHWLGQREGDILTFPRSRYRGGRFHVTQSKTNARVSIPDKPVVARRIEQELARQAARLGMADEPHKIAHRTLLVCDTTDQPWTEFYFRHVFADIRAAAAEEWPAFEDGDGNQVAFADLWFMHLRHTAVTELAIFGCTALQISGITGHTPKTVEQILNRYLVRTGALADAAAKKRLEGEQARELEAVKEQPGNEGV